MKAIQFKNTTYLKQFMLLILLVLIVPISVSCSEDNDIVKEEPKESIIGKWQLIEELLESKDEISVLSECEKKSTIEFKLDGTYELISFTLDKECTSETTIHSWVDKGNNILEVFHADGGSAIGNYLFIDGNLKLVVYDEDGNEDEYYIYKKI